MNPNALNTTSTPESRPSRERGFSLIEVMVAGGLLAGVLVSISTMFIVGSQSVKSGRELTKATTLANSALEQVMGWSYDRVWGFTGGTGDSETTTWTTDLANPAYTIGTDADHLEWNALADSWRDTVQGEYGEGLFTYRVDGVARLPDGADDGLTSYREGLYLRVTITIAWTEARGRRRHVTFEQLVL
jgi:type II secretory pathway pseudopilin PulG